MSNRIIRFFSVMVCIMVIVSFCAINAIAEINIEPNSWIDMNPSIKPSARHYHAMAYDSQSDRVIMFGGWIGSVSNPPYHRHNAETWAYDFNTNTWADMNPLVNPSGRAEIPIVYNSKIDKIFLYGGRTGIYETSNEIWLYDFDNNTWEQKFPSFTPRAKFGYSIGYDTKNEKVILFGGVTGFWSFTNETWEYDFSNNDWRNRNATGDIPIEVVDRPMSYDSKSGKMLLYASGKTYSYDYEKNEWSEINFLANIPSPVAMTYLSQTDNTILYGTTGGNCCSGSSLTWTYNYNSNEWTDMNPTVSPSPRGFSQMAYDSESNKVILFGGYIYPEWSNLNDTWAYQPKQIYQEVLIDIKPGSFPNSINLRNGGTVPVAILSNTSFDATTVDPMTVTLASAPIKRKRNGTIMSSTENINGDALLDLVVHVSTQALQLSETDTEAVLEGKTFNGTSIRGTDSVRVVH